MKRRRMSRTKGEGQRGRDVAIDSESCRPRPSSPGRDPGHRERMEGEGERVVGGRGGGGKMKEGGGRKGRAPPSAARPDRSKTSRLLSRRRSLQPFAAHIGEKNKKQDVKDAALISPRHGDTLTSASSFTPLGSEALGSPARAQSARTGEAETGSVSQSAEETWRPERRRRWRQTQRRTVGGRIVQFCQNLSGRGRFELPRERLDVS